MVFIYMIIQVLVTISCCFVLFVKWFGNSVSTFMSIKRIELNGESERLINIKMEGKRLRNVVRENERR